MQPNDPSVAAATGPDVADADDTTHNSAPRARLRLASAVMFVRELEQSATFYTRLLGWAVVLRDYSAALLVSPDGSQLYLRSMGPNAHHPQGHVGIQYLIWTAEDAADLDRCERVLLEYSPHVTRTTGDGFTVLEGRGPDYVPILITYPGPDLAPRHQIMGRIYQW
jgi:catechol 2,3-dioxygenase-like lactoylglutathione lyase family enzyme